MDAQINDLQPLYSSEEQDAIQSEEQLEQLQLDRASSFKEYIFNLKYNILHSNLVPFARFQRKPIQLSPDSQPAYMLGNCYNCSQMEEFLKHFRSTIWMSYRASNKKTDAGWGCTIRAMQMVLAETIKRNNPEIQLHRVVQLFKQGTKHPFSLDHICQRGNISTFWNDLDARWTGINQIASIITSILKDQAKKQELRKGIDLKISSEIFYGITTIHSKNNLDSDPHAFPKLIVVSNKISKENNQLNPTYIPHLQHLMKMNNFCGMVGGISGQALYVIGFQQDKAIILDPHYVQETQGKGKQQEVFFKKTPRGIPLNRLSSSISVCFFLKDAYEYQIWSGQMCYAQRIYSPNLITQIYTQDPNQQVEQYRKRSEDFQIL